MADINRSPDTGNPDATGRPRGRGWAPPLRHRDSHAGLWIGIALLVAAIVVVIAFTAMVLRGQAH